MNLRGHGRVAFNWRTLIPICGVVFFFIVSTKRKERMENLKIFGLDIRHALIFVVISRLILEKITGERLMILHSGQGFVSTVIFVKNCLYFSRSNYVIRAIREIK